MTATKIVTKIEPIITSIAQPLKKKQKRNTAGYGRVSTDLTEQESSFEAQVEYYTRMIQANPEWHFVGVYADEGISGTSTKGREQFNRMIEDALAGKIDLIITKSVSRFARNTVDSLQTIRKLKEVGCECYFEKEQIWTFDGKGELLLTIMASLAQEESRSISENVTWGKRRAFEAGRFSLPYKQFLGYEKGADGRPQIVENEAAVIRLIYTLFLQGKTVNFIARHLTAQGIATPSGKEKWAVSSVQSILRNEKYKGEAILQKAYTVDFLEKKRKKNEGEIPQFHVENSHPAIVTPEQYELVQAELERRALTAGSRQSGLSPYSSKLICESCGSFFGPKTWHSTSLYRRVIWQCNQKYRKVVGEEVVNDSSRGVHQGDVVCKTRFVTEEEIQWAFTQAFNSLISDRAALVEQHRAIMDELTDTAALDSKIAKYIDECDVIAGLIRKAVDEGASTAVGPADYEERYNALVARYEAAKEKHEAATREKRSRELRRVQADAFFAEVCGRVCPEDTQQSVCVNEHEQSSCSSSCQREGLLAGFDEELWNCTVETVMVLENGEFRVRFKDGQEVEVAAK